MLFAATAASWAMISRFIESTTDGRATGRPTARHQWHTNRSRTLVPCRTLIRHSQPVPTSWADSDKIQSRMIRMGIPRVLTGHPLRRLTTKRRRQSLHWRLLAVFLAIAVGVLITRIGRSCAGAAWADAAGCVETPRVTLLLPMLAAAGALMTAKAAACETYEKNRTQTDETV